MLLVVFLCYCYCCCCLLNPKKLNPSLFAHPLILRLFTNQTGAIFIILEIDRRRDETSGVTRSSKWVNAKSR